MQKIKDFFKQRWEEFRSALEDRFDLPDQVDPGLRTFYWGTFIFSAMTSTAFLFTSFFRGELVSFNMVMTVFYTISGLFLFEKGIQSWYAMFVKYGERGRRDLQHVAFLGICGSFIGAAATSCLELVKTAGGLTKGGTEASMQIFAQWMPVVLAGFLVFHLIMLLNTMFIDDGEEGNITETYDRGEGMRIIAFLMVVALLVYLMNQFLLSAGFEPGLSLAFTLISVLITHAWRHTIQKGKNPVVRWVGYVGFIGGATLIVCSAAAALFLFPGDIVHLQPARALLFRTDQPGALLGIDVSNLYPIIMGVVIVSILWHMICLVIYFTPGKEKTASSPAPAPVEP